jgi:hypothetical protein
MINIKSAVGWVLGFVCADPKYTDLSVAYLYAVVVSNFSGADITTGTMKFQSATALANNPCAPDPATWADVQVSPECNPDPNAATATAQITISAQNPLKNGGWCAYAVPCPNQFIKLVGVPTGADAVCVLTRLKRSGIPTNPVNLQVH